MSGDSYEVPPLQRRQIRKVAEKVRDIALALRGEAQDRVFFDIIRFLDVLLPKVSPEFVVEIIEWPVMRQEFGEAHAMTIPADSLILVREDIWDRAAEGAGRDRLTLAHELGHLILHAKPGFGRRLESPATPRFRQSEWQANAFAGELLVPVHLIGDCRSPAEVAEACSVSQQAAEVQWGVFKRERLV